MRGLCLVALLAVGAVAQERLRPVARVVALLSDMAEQLRNEMDQDQKMYENLHCWCKNNRGNKEAAISTGNAQAKKLANSIDELKAAVAELTGKIDKGNADLTKLQNALEEAKKQYEKESAEWQDDDKDYMENINAVKNAITVLKKHNFLQASKIMPRLFAKTNEHLLGDLIKKARILMLERPEIKSYNSRSGEIIGVLEQMLERFQSQRSSAQKERDQKKKAFFEMKAAKEEEQAALYKMVERMAKEKADKQTDMENKKTELRELDAALAADMEFLADLEQKCSRTDTEYESRQKTRAAEIAAVQDAIRIINDDEARATFDRSVNKKGTAANNVDVGFLQLRSRRQSMRASVVEVLEKAAMASKNPQLAMLAVSAKLDAFTKVKKAIDQMIGDLKKEQQDEVEYRDWCNKELNDNTQETASKDQDKAQTLEDLAATEQRLKELEAEIKAANERIAEAKNEMVRAADNRGEANAEFQQTVKDQRMTQDVLNRAFLRLKKFYDPEVVLDGYNEQPAMDEGRMMFRGKLFSGTTQDGKQYKDGIEVGSGEVADAGTVTELAQKDEDARAPGAKAPPPPKGFEDYKKNEGGNKVLLMLQKVIADSKATEAQAMQDEKEQQAVYEGFVKDTNHEVKTLMEQVANWTQEKADKEQLREELRTQRDELMATLEALDKYNKELHKDCDFILRNFDVRQGARSQEMEALRQAKAILSGSMEG
jgi:chromosome segregation ATPase